MTDYSLKNLLNSIKPVLTSVTTEDDGVFHSGAVSGHIDRMWWVFNEQPELDTDKTLHVGLSVKGAVASAKTFKFVLQRKNADGSIDCPTACLPVNEAWTRVEGTINLPTGVTPLALFVTSDGECPELWFTSPCASYDSPITLVSSSHTPYATEGHLQAKYASQEQLSSVSSKFTQTAQGFNASITTVTKALDDATGRISELKNLSDNMIGENGTFTNFYNSATSYMKFEYDENLKDSYLVLGQTDSTLSLRIGNDRIEFMDGKNVIAYVDGDKLFINNVQVVKRHMIADLEKNHGGFVFDTRENGNMCVRWITG